MQQDPGPQPWETCPILLPFIKRALVLLVPVVFPVPLELGAWPTEEGGELPDFDKRSSPACMLEAYLGSQGKKKVKPGLRGGDVGCGIT